MFGQKRNLAESLFRSGILSTFGKLDQRDIDKIDGHLDRLADRLVALYGWDENIARCRAETFSASITPIPINA